MALMHIYKFLYSLPFLFFHQIFNLNTSLKNHFTTQPKKRDVLYLELEWTWVINVKGRILPKENTVHYEMFFEFNMDSPDLFSYMRSIKYLNKCESFILNSKCFLNLNFEMIIFLIYPSTPNNFLVFEVHKGLRVETCLFPEFIFLLSQKNVSGIGQRIPCPNTPVPAPCPSLHCATPVHL